VKAGHTIDLDLEELGAGGSAEVMAIRPCPEIAPRPGSQHRLVTGKFSHSAANVLHIRVADLRAPIGVTANHPFWSEDRRQFVAAGDLRVGEGLRQADASTTRVLGIDSSSQRARVYNLEVEGEHVYCVSESAVLVHNAYNHAAKYVTYLGTNKVTGKLDWVGITRNFAARERKHSSVRTIESVVNNGGYRQSRLLEVELIRRLTDAGKVLANTQRQIRKSKLKQYTEAQWQWAKTMADKIMGDLGYEG
jgi:hypothetical protein